MTLPYRIALIALLLTGFAFSLSPWLTLRAISQAAAANNAQQWPELVQTQGLQAYAGKLLEALLDLKMYAEMKANPREAMRDNQASKEQLAKVAGQFADPQGLKHLLCGGLNGDPHGAALGQTGCWALDGQVRWESPERVRFIFTNPDTHWQSSLIMARVGVFTWQAVDVELPVEAILERFAGSVGLKSPARGFE